MGSGQTLPLLLLPEHYPRFYILLTRELQYPCGSYMVKNTIATSPSYHKLYIFNVIAVLSVYWASSHFGKKKVL